MSQLVAAGGAVGLTALASCAAERLAEQRVALDAVQAEESLPSWPPLSPLLPQPRPRPMLHIYWPADARAPAAADVSLPFVTTMAVRIVR